MTYEELVNSGKSIGNMTNDELITYCSGLLEEIWEYDKRFDRAIKYIEFTNRFTNSIDMNNLKNILKGSDKE